MLPVALTVTLIVAVEEILLFGTLTVNLLPFFKENEVPLFCPETITAPLAPEIVATTLLILEELTVTLFEI